MKLRAITIETYGCGYHLIMRGDKPIATVLTKDSADQLCTMFNDLVDDLNYKVESSAKGERKWD